MVVTPHPALGSELCWARGDRGQGPRLAPLPDPVPCQDTQWYLPGMRHPGQELDLGLFPKDPAEHAGLGGVCVRDVREGKTRDNGPWPLWKLCPLKRRRRPALALGPAPSGCSLKVLSKGAWCLRDLFQLTLWLADHHVAPGPGFEFPNIQSTLGHAEPSTQCGLNMALIKRRKAEETEWSPGGLGQALRLEGGSSHLSRLCRQPRPQSVLTDLRQQGAAAPQPQMPAPSAPRGPTRRSLGRPPLLRETRGRWPSQPLSLCTWSPSAEASAKDALRGRLRSWPGAGGGRGGPRSEAEQPAAGGQGREGPQPSQRSAEAAPTQRRKGQRLGSCAEA